MDNKKKAIVIVVACIFAAMLIANLCASVTTCVKVVQFHGKGTSTYTNDAADDVNQSEESKEIKTFNIGAEDVLYCINLWSDKEFEVATVIPAGKYVGVTYKCDGGSNIKYSCALEESSKLVSMIDITLYRDSTENDLSVSKLVIYQVLLTIFPDMDETTILDAVKELFADGYVFGNGYFMSKTELNDGDSFISIAPYEE